MTVHNYRSRQVHETLNGVNPSSGFRDMRSAKSGPKLWQIWQVFGPWASPYGANGQMNMTVHNYRPRQFHRTSNGENPSSGFRDMGSASLAAARPTARPPGPWRQYPSSPEGWGVKREVDIISRYKWWINEELHRWSFDKPSKIVYHWYLKYLLTRTFSWWLRNGVSIPRGRRFHSRKYVVKKYQLEFISTFRRNISLSLEELVPVMVSKLKL